ncbi:uncharacterized protein LOC116849931 [Odontomachus brunneus]|uniref:uncharacterized protein LOC116849931 n=1 Tax=Odontomachus brunneus TaxID=486640 RepID=UPI0013F232EE|nr:uncharacterized protein LOC116849931 [Odontomachus brunneus]XP_032683493.1 uncharacterized protein LOC116849931 [Odontomachus brunneus]XP_032683494.1 uncharacterized protein LOC116849931 [Odontomachus brunneus]
MADKLNSNTKKLRKKSQILLAKVDEDSKRVDTEVKKLRSQILSLVNNHIRRSQSDHVGKNVSSWKLRNDSSEISAVLCPDYYRFSSRRATTSAPDMTSSAKLTLTSKKQCARIAPRKPVKECYCYTEVNKANLRSRIRRKASPCRQCRSQFELKPVKETDDRASLISPISCETYRRVRKIDYTPRSQFLRNVQTRLCETWQSGGRGDCSQTCPRSSSYHRVMAGVKVQNVDSDRQTTLLKEAKLLEEQKSPAIPKAPANSIASESDRDNVVCSSSKETRTSSRRRPKPTLKKMISSKRPKSRSPARSERTSRSTHDYHCCCRDESEETTRYIGDKREKKHLPRYREQRIQRTHSRYDGDPVADDISADDPIDKEVRDLRRFREQNYFETHGSSHTLVSSRSSGSLEQYLLNERLFPEPVGKIHKQDLVVTMPPCATTERKRIHYFPRHVVRQEKNVYNTNYRRKRHQSCPLTGHTIDLGILKAKLPLNSLALKYQKY